MSGLEQAIRNALERAERSDPDIRARIYQSARNALDTGLRKQEVGDPQVIERQRQRLEMTINDIEDEELARLRSIARFEKVALDREPEDEPGLVEHAPEAEYDSRTEDTAPIIEHEAPAPHEQQAQREVRIEPEQPIEREARTEPEIRIEPNERASAAQPADDDTLSDFFATRERLQEKPAGKVEETNWDEAAGSPVPREQRKGRGAGSTLVSLFVYACLIGIIGVGVWWLYATGMIDAAMKGNSDFDLVPKQLQSATSETAHTETRLDTLRGFSGEWMDIYRPGSNSELARPRSKAVIEEGRDSDGVATIISSNAPDQDGDVLVEVPASILQELAGKTSTLAITVKSNTEKPAQIYIQCEFQTLGDCGRHRYTVTNERADELIQVKFDGKLGPSEPGHIVINSDLTGEGSTIRLYGIRVLPGS
ncbi:MAG: putative regulatory protein BirS [Rhizobium sp.]|nr:putative regulatory protein BirS [Rhizobium sp.]